MSKTSFDLLDEEWIPVRQVDGPLRTVSLVGVLDGAHDIASVVGELPTQAFAIQRLLLAVLHRSILGGSGSAMERWSRVWRAGRMPMEDIATYLERHRERFDLLHPMTPFYQVADLRTASGETKGLEVLVADVPNGHQYFTTRAGDGLKDLSFAEAARWVVHAQAFDPSGIKSGAVGDDRVKGGRGYPIGTSWVGGLGGILAEGSTLFQTLMFNLVAADGPYRDSDDLPVWERPPQGAAVEDRAGRGPSGTADLLTWQSRRIRLVRREDRVVGVLIANGDPLSPQNRMSVEHMTVWRRSQPQEKKLGLPTVYMPRIHQPERALWRGLEGLLPNGDAAAGGSRADPTRPPEVLQWIAGLRMDDLLDADQVVRTRAVGITYGSKSSVVASVTDDVVLVRADVLANQALSLDPPIGLGFERVGA